MERIAVWGYGPYGRNLVARLRETRGEDVRITAVYDRGFRKMRDEGYTVRDPDTMAADYRRGEFDAVLLASGSEITCRSMRRALKAAQIPVKGAANDPVFPEAGKIIRAALWGYGIYGQRLFSALRTQWADRISVTAVYDVKKHGTRAENLTVLDPSDIGRDYARGQFDAVLPAVNAAELYRSMRERLNRHGIPLLELTPDAAFATAARFKRDEAPGLTIDQPGYAFHVFRDLCGAVSLAPSTGIMYLFDQEGRALKNHWNAYAPLIDNATHQFDCPVRLGSGGEAVPMPGDYCILAKLWAINYSHFTFESMDCVQLLEEAGFSGRYVIPGTPSNRALMKLYGIRDERILTQYEFEPGRTYKFQRVFFPELLNNDRAHSAPVLARMAERVLGRLPETGKTYPARLYVVRGGTRKLLNGRAVAERYGFETMNPDEHTVEEQIQYFRRAEIVLSPHGANNANALYMQPGSVLIETFGQNWVKYSYIHALRQRGVYYLPVVEGPIMPREDDVRNSQLDYDIPEINLVNAVETALALRKAGKNG